MKYMKVLLVALLILMSGCAKEKDKVIINENGINTVVMGEKEMEWFRFGNEDGPKVVILPGVSFRADLSVLQSHPRAECRGKHYTAADYGRPQARSEAA